MLLVFFSCAAPSSTLDTAMLRFNSGRRLAALIALGAGLTAPVAQAQIQPADIKPIVDIAAAVDSVGDDIVKLYGGRIISKKQEKEEKCYRAVFDVVVDLSNDLSILGDMALLSTLTHDPAEQQRVRETLRRQLHGYEDQLREYESTLMRVNTECKKFEAHTAPILARVPDAISRTKVLLERLGGR